MILNQHEQRVEKFYTMGSKVNLALFNIDELELHNDGYLSFGYWENESDTYLVAAKRLLDYFISNSGIKETEKILNVACGFGTESFAFYENFKPKELIGIDVAKVHTDMANMKAKKLGVDKNVKFIHGDAVRLDFPPESFSHILGIEGPAHFNTREEFFRSANRVLKKDGELILTDIIQGDGFEKRNIIQNFAFLLAQKGWVTPKENQVNDETYKKQLENAGFKILVFNKIGDKVLRGYGRSFNRKVRKENHHMGFINSVSFALIGRLLGYFQKNGLIDYIYVKARKIA